MKQMKKNQTKENKTEQKTYPDATEKMKTK